MSRKKRKKIKKIPFLLLQPVMMNMGSGILFHPEGVKHTLPNSFNKNLFFSIRSY